MIVQKLCQKLSTHFIRNVIHVLSPNCKPMYNYVCKWEIFFPHFNVFKINTKYFILQRLIAMFRKNMCHSKWTMFMNKNECWILIHEIWLNFNNKTLRVSQWFLFVPYLSQFVRIIVTMRSYHVLVVELCILFFIKMKFIAMEWFDVCFFRYYSEENIVEFKVLSVETRVIHIDESFLR